MKQSSWLDNLVWVLLILFLVPSSVVVFSWNSLPGSRLFRVKLVMEDAILALAPTQEFKGDLHVAFTERRVSEATKLLADSSSTEGLVYLNAEIISAKESIQKAPTSEAKKQIAKKYIATLRNVNTQLLQQRQIMASRAGNDAPPPKQIVYVQERVIVQQPIYIIQQPNNTATPTPIPTPRPTAAPLEANQQENNYEQIDNLIETSNQAMVELGVTGDATVEPTSAPVVTPTDIPSNKCNGPNTLQQCFGHDVGYCTGNCKCVRVGSNNCTCEAKPDCNGD